MKRAAQSAAWKGVPIVFALLCIACWSSAAQLPAGKENDNHILSLRPTWEKTLDSTILDWQSDLLFATGSVLILAETEFGKVWALDVNSGRLLWQWDGPGHSGPDPTGDGDVLVEEGYDTLVRLDGRTGKPKWRCSLDGSFADDGYVTIAGHIGCAVYHSWEQLEPESTEYTLNRRTIIDLRTGKPTPVQLPYNPLIWFTLNSPPRFLYQVPDLYGGSSSVKDQVYSLVRPGRESVEYPYFVGCLDAATGNILWQTDLGPISNRRRPEYLGPRSLQAPLGVCQFTCATPTEKWTELWWMDFDSGEVLRKDHIAVSPYDIGPVIEGPAVEQPATARSLLSAARLLLEKDWRLSLVEANNPEQPLRSKDLAPLLPEALKQARDVSWGVTDCAWSFVTLYVRRGRSDSTKTVETLLLVDLERGAVYHVATARRLSVLLDATHHMLYVFSVPGNTLAGYKLPDTR